MSRAASEWSKWLAKCVGALSILMVLVGLGLHLRLNTYSLSDVEFWSELLTFAAAMVYSVLAVFIIARNPQNTIGWLFLVVGFFSSLPVLNQGVLYVDEMLESELFSGLFAWIGHLIWIPAFLIPITLMLQFFPDGRLPSKRWWPVPAATIIGLLGYAASIAFYPWPWEEQDILETNNPFGVAGGEAFLTTLSEISFIFLTIGFVGTLAAVVVRLHRARGVERQQIKWLVYTAVVSISVLLLFTYFGDTSSWIFDLLFRSLPTIFALVIGTAILHHRLFDIDIIIRRTVQYAAVSAVLVGVYFGSVVLLQAVFTQVVEQQSPMILILSTLFTAALFNPIRHRIQTFIDHRFYRSKYDAQQVLAQFNRIAVDEVDIPNLTKAVLDVVGKTMQPDQVNLWLKQPSSSGSVPPLEKDVHGRDGG